MARLLYNAAELSWAVGKDDGFRVTYYRYALHSLADGCFDLSMKKWVDLVSIKSENP